jgi:hypothetical protein
LAVSTLHSVVTTLARSDAGQADWLKTLKDALQTLNAIGQTADSG